MKLSLIACFLFGLQVAAQQLPEPKPFIEVTGNSETEIVPDIIELAITLQEYTEGKNKMEISRQEEELKKNLKDLGIDLKNLTLLTAYADYQRIRMMKKDVVNSKKYLLKVSSADMVGKVYERLDKMNVHDARLTKLDHSQILELQKQNRIKAIKAAREKAEYLLNAIGHKPGAALQVNEGENWVEGSEQGPRPLYKNAIQAYGNDGMLNEDESISIRKIKIRSGVMVRFEIK